MSDFGKIAAALVQAQKSIALPAKNKTVKVTVKKQDGTFTSYSFMYTTLDELIDNVRKPLTDNGLFFTQELCGVHGALMLKTTLWHESGQHIESMMPVVLTGSKAQEIGSAITYMKRYALSAILAQPSDDDDDDDGNTADGNTIEKSTEKKKPPTTLSKPLARPVFDKLEKEYSAIKTITELDAWWTSSKRDRQSMPEDWKAELASRWTAYKKSIMETLAARHGIPAEQEDAS